MQVELTQYLRPTGRPQKVFCEVPDALREKVAGLKQAGCILTAEVLTTGEVSLTIEHFEGNFEIVVAPNEAEKTVAGLVELIGKWDRQKFDAWLRSLEE